MNIKNKRSLMLESDFLFLFINLNNVKRYF
nr:MAG TPA: hypothetical protein [Caudoviricetes sp.]